jgi:toxin ParE1/3/4
MAEIIWTEPALSDLDAIADYIVLDNPEAAARLVKNVFAHVEHLARHPRLGSRIPELRYNPRYRQIVESPCRVFYRWDKKTKVIYILGVMRGERLFRKSWLKTRDHGIK